MKSIIIKAPHSNGLSLDNPHDITVAVGVLVFFLDDFHGVHFSGNLFIAIHNPGTANFAAHSTPSSNRILQIQLNEPQ
jgi:hypothetical protein